MALAYHSPFSKLFMLKTQRLSVFFIKKASENQSNQIQNFFKKARVLT